MEWIEKKIAEYYSWLKDNTAIRQDKGTGWFAISTPFVGMFNDNIEIFVKQVSETQIDLSDDGETIGSLRLSGVDVLRSDKRKSYLHRILSNHGIFIEGDELKTVSNGADFAKKKHSLISAIMNVSDMSLLAKGNISSMFSEDVMSFADSRDVVYTPSFIIKGKSGLDFNFDFQIAGKNSELVVKSFSTLRQDSVGCFLFCLEDTRKKREMDTGKQFRSLAVVNDSVRQSQKLIDALRSYDTDVLLWSKREEQAYKDIFKVA